MKYLSLLSPSLSLGFGLGLVPLASCLLTAHNFTVPIDHFHNESLYEPHTNDTFNLRYWFDASHYQPGGPVFLMAGGETDASYVLPVLSHGILANLAKTYHGVALLLEHRYHGTSYPVDKITISSLRFLSTEQAMADYAYFAQHVTGLPGMPEGTNLSPTASDTKWIAYGVSYAGGFVSFLRKLYPDVIFGAISSSGTTAAIVDYWQYFDLIQQYAPADCVAAIQDFVRVVDGVLIDHADNATLAQQFKAALGAEADSANDVFAHQIAQILQEWQGRNWYAPKGSLLFRDYCGNSTEDEVLLYPGMDSTRAFLEHVISLAALDASDEKLVTRVLNQAGFLKDRIFKYIKPSFSPSSAEKAEIKEQEETLPHSDGYNWVYQTCTEWGYFKTGSGYPSTIQPIVSRLVSLSSASRMCVDLFNITRPPQVHRINRYGGLNFTFPRVAAIGGAADPWREVTPLATTLGPLRPSTDEMPVVQIDIAPKDVWDGLAGAVHHWEANGADTDDFPKGEEPPKAIVQAWEEILRFVGVWLES